VFNEDDRKEPPFRVSGAAPLDSAAFGVDTSAAAPEANHRPVRLIVEHLDRISRVERISLGQIVQSFGRTSFLPVMLVPALLLVSPLSGIPLFSTVCGLSIALVALQRVAQRDRLWLPGWLTRRQISGAALGKGAAALRWVADWLDRNSRPRLQILVTPPLNVLCFLICAMAGLTIPFLELVPFSSSILGLVVTLTVVGLLVRDGVYVLVALGLAGAAGSVPFVLVSKVVD